MESTEILDAVSVISAILVLGYASLLDLRTRRVGNVPWIILSAIGVALLLSRLFVDEAPLEYVLILVPVAAILGDVYVTSGEGGTFARFAPYMEYGIAAVSILVLGYMWGDEEYFRHVLAVPVMMLVIVLFYILDIVRGGADAKALLALTILFPFYPDFESIPLISVPDDSSTLLFPFSFIVLVMAAIIVALLPAGFLARNMLKREVALPYAALGYMMDSDKARGRHVWLMERMEGGQHVFHTRPKRKEDLHKELGLLEEAGHKRVWVTPKIPFIPMILAGVLFVTIVGNIFFILFQ
jgi:preflagellin peptidase FlaK